MKLRKRFGFIAAITAALIVWETVPAPGTENSIEYELVIDAEKTGVEISDTMYGLFYEDINYAADGGMYPEYVNNRSFEFTDISANNRQPLKHWFINSGKLGEGEVIAKNENPLNESNTTYIEVSISEAPYVIANNGYSNDSNPDMSFLEGAEYKLYFYARDIDFSGDIKFVLDDGKGNACSDEISVKLESSEWSKYGEYILTASKGTKGRLKIVCDGTGSFDLDFVSLMPSDTWGSGNENWKYGGLRKDLVEALAALNPGFIRFPGGCIVEGAYRHETHYNWKDTIGAPEQRKENPNLWGYMMSYGLGYHEYFQLCEDLGSEPVPVIHAGILCQPRNNGSNTEADWKPGDPEFDTLINDYLDLIEYANGSTDTYWGAKRAENGHSEPFNLKKIGIGNENWGIQYWRNFAAIKEAILEVYPEMEIITTTGPLESGWINDAAWVQINAFHKDVIADEHYYMAPEWFLENTKRYDKYKRDSAKIFVGEFAAHEAVAGDRRPNTLYSALCEAAFMTGLERNSDVVKMASYAPLFARVLMFQWSPDMIWFNSKEITRLTPNYYVQKLFAENTGDMTLVPDFPDTTDVFQATSIDYDTKTVYTKLINPYDTAKIVNIEYSNFENIPDKAQMIVLSGKKQDLDVKAEESEMKCTDNTISIELEPYSMISLAVQYGADKSAAEESIVEESVIEENATEEVSDSTDKDIEIADDNSGSGSGINTNIVIAIISAVAVVGVGIVLIMRIALGKKK